MGGGRGELTAGHSVQGVQEGARHSRASTTVYLLAPPVLHVSTPTLSSAFLCTARFASPRLAVAALCPPSLPCRRIQTRLPVSKPSPPPPRATAQQVKHTAAHPSLDLVAAADEGGIVSIFDFARKEVVLSFSPSALYASQKKRRDAFGWGRPSAGGDAVAQFASQQLKSRGGGGAVGRRREPATGKVLQVLFFDDDALACLPQREGQELEFQVARAAAEAADGGRPAGMVGGRRLVVVVCERVVLLVDLATGECVEEIHAAADLGSGSGTERRGPEPTCAALVSARLLAIGCSDGRVRVWDRRLRAVDAVLCCGHRRDAGICALESVSLCHDGAGWVAASLSISLSISHSLYLSTWALSKLSLPLSSLSPSGVSSSLSFKTRKGSIASPSRPRLRVLSLGTGGESLNLLLLIHLYYTD